MSRTRQDSGLLQLEMFVSTNGGTAVLSQDALSVAVEVCVTLFAKQNIRLSVRIQSVNRSPPQLEAL